MLLNQLRAAGRDARLWGKSIGERHGDLAYVSHSAMIAVDIGARRNAAWRSYMADDELSVSSILDEASLLNEQGLLWDAALAAEDYGDEADDQIAAQLDDATSDEEMAVADQDQEAGAAPPTPEPIAQLAIGDGPVTKAENMSRFLALRLACGTASQDESELASQNAEITG